MTQSVRTGGYIVSEGTLLVNLTVLNEKNWSTENLSLMRSVVNLSSS